MKKTIPTFGTDKETEDFVATADLTNYDLSGGEVMRFELKRKDKSANLRLPAQLLEAVQNGRNALGCPSSGLFAWRLSGPCTIRSKNGV